MHRAVLVCRLPELNPIPSRPLHYAEDQGGRWQEIEETVRLPREDIVYATENVHRLIDALKDGREK